MFVAAYQRVWFYLVFLRKDQRLHKLRHGCLLLSIMKFTFFRQRAFFLSFDPENAWNVEWTGQSNMDRPAKQYRELAEKLKSLFGANGLSTRNCRFTLPSFPPMGGCRVRFRPICAKLRLRCWNFRIPVALSSPTSANTKISIRPIKGSSESVSKPSPSHSAMWGRAQNAACGFE